MFQGPAYPKEIEHVFSYQLMDEKTVLLTSALTPAEITRLH